MIKIENRCCGCAVPGYPCLGVYCSLRNVEVHYCDKCGEEMGELEIDDSGEDICASCREEMDEVE